MDYLLSRESYAKDTSNLSLKLGRSYEYAELTYSGCSFRGTGLSSKAVINPLTEDERYCTTKLLTYDTGVIRCLFVILRYVEPKKPGSKTLVFAIVVILIVIAVGLYYVTALGNSDNRPRNVETQSTITILPQR